MSRTKYFLLLLLLAALAALFVALNAQRVSVELGLGAVSTRLGVALVLALALGLLIGAALRGWWVAELLAERGRLRRALKVAEARVRTLVSTQDSGGDVSPP